MARDQRWANANLAIALLRCLNGSFSTLCHERHAVPKEIVSARAAAKNYKIYVVPVFRFQIG